MKRVYKPLEELSDDEIKSILQANDTETLITLPLSIGMYHMNWKYAQDTCVKLSEHSDPRVRANAILGLAYVARTHKKLEKHIVKPVILRALKNDKEYEWRVKDAIEDINLFMNWDLGEFALNKDNE